MRHLYTLLTFITAGFIFCFHSKAQLVIDGMSSGQALAQKLVGDGVTISNVSFTGRTEMAGIFTNTGNNNIGIDSGIVLTNGLARSNPFSGTTGLNGNGVILAAQADAHTQWNFPGDANLAALIGEPVSETNDACVLEFDFVPLGDSIKFRYVFSSEEYPDFACSNFNDAFAFFISGPGFPANSNIALIPGTNDPVTINNINGSNCPTPTPYPQYFVDNESNTWFTHNGHTTLFTALARVQPCQTYHLKLVIADVGDDDYDSGVFLEAKSLSSNATTLVNLTQTDPQSGMSYLVEGCATGSLNIKRQTPGPFPLVINLSYGGTAQNGIDVQTLPSSVVIPANQDSVLLNIFPIMDLVPEGIETLKIYTLAGCASGLPTDSTTIQLRDYDILGIQPDTTYLCRNDQLQLQASGGYTTYSWDPNPALSSVSIPNPTVNLASGSAMFICVAQVGTCLAKDSAFVRVKDLELLSKQDVNCRGGNSGLISVGAGPEWPRPLEFSINGGLTYQADSSFSNLPVGNYFIRVRDASGCIDSIPVNIVQAYPDLTQTFNTTPASCTGIPDGSITVTANGGNPAYQYSINNGSFGSNNVFNVALGTYTIVVKDANGCTISTGVIDIPLNNNLTVDAGPDATICEGRSTQLNASASLAVTYAWSPAVSLTSTTVSNPTASPVVTTQYKVTATFGVCAKTDSVTVTVNPAPIPDAGPDISICYGANALILGAGDVEFNWTPSTYLSSTTIAQPTSVKPLDDITYYLEVKDANGCISLKKDTVKVSVTPAVKLFAGNDSVVVAVNQPVQLNVLQQGAQTVTQYSWTPSYGLNDPNIRNPIVTLDREFTYIVTGRTAANCEGSDTIFIKVYRGPEIYVPTAFTPNGDGNNDVLRAIAVGMKEYRYFKVFNRYGQEVFSTRDFTRGWDGRIKGVIQPMGTFVWVAETVDYIGNKVQRKGTTMIIH